MVRHRNGRPQEDPWRCAASVYVAVMHCWEISFGEADSYNVIFLSVLSIYLRINLIFSGVYSSCIVFIRDTFCVVVFYYMFMCISCFGLVVSRPTCQVIGWKDSSADGFVW